ncbi:hypothetical protein G6F46_006563 [Rhizopus delemar]|uniref:Uncharacterized protein n=2 Tax=Rhizopus TaxID=4842 RepID=A0A9P6Z2S3_9FUNG|nr:hypothetical protein G6F55_005193 [Rhizopus delemar]KAG1544716.1 hypothetical protein G6F51_005894 [Rhizopus arrhizus]KAG1511003.1 hypothetical protein G6F53_006260 [Rhizopus delemar]KAG1519718.1 hypothetical protein G6F52_008348 [Rhizopus delemar]KAG1569527.1 hypothetical protein G6F50_006293 [Rhizopus delemar]
MKFLYFKWEVDEPSFPLGDVTSFNEYLDFKPPEKPKDERKEATNSKLRFQLAKKKSMEASDEFVELRKPGSGRPVGRPPKLTDAHRQYLVKLVDENDTGLALDQMMESLTTECMGLQMSKLAFSRVCQNKIRTHIQFLDVIEYVEDQEKRAKILDTYNKWRKSKKATKYWKQRDQANNGNADKNDVITKSNLTSTGSITLETTETVESVTLDEAKKIISENLTLCDNSTDECICQSMYNSLGFKPSDHKFPMKIMMALIQIVNNVHYGSASRIDTATKLLALTSDNIDPIIIKLLLCVKSMIETLPLDNQTEEIQEFELCTRYLQPFFQPLFDSGDDKILFKWTNTIGLKNTGNDILTKSRPDGCVKDSRKPIGFYQSIFAKEATTEYKLKHTFEVMVIGTNIKF